MDFLIFSKEELHICELFLKKKDVGPSVGNDTLGAESLGHGRDVQQYC